MRLVHVSRSLAAFTIRCQGTIIGCQGVRGISAIVLISVLSGCRQDSDGCTNGRSGVAIASCFKKRKIIYMSCFDRPAKLGP